MPLLVYGLNHKTATLEIRSRVAFAEPDRDRALRSLKQNVPKAREAVIVSTCNRLEIHTVIEQRDTEDISTWLAKERNISRAELDFVSYQYWDDAAILHVYRVAAGLDSQIIGEPQILGQVRDAYRSSGTLGLLGPRLKLLGDLAIRTAKDVRNKSGIGEKPVSVAFATVKMVEQVFSKVENISFLLIGAGDNIASVAAHLDSHGAKQLTIANRTHSRAIELANKYAATTLAFEDIASRLGSFDVVISSTANDKTLLGKAEFVSALDQRKNKPMLVVDLAVPRDIEETVQDLDDIYLVTIDSLTDIIRDNLTQRREAAQVAQSLIEQAAASYSPELRIAGSGTLVSNWRDQQLAIRDKQVDKALSRIKSGDRVEDVVNRLGRDLTNQLTHKPTVLLREAIATNDLASLEFIRRFFDIPMSDIPAIDGTADE